MFRKVTNILKKLFAYFAYSKEYFLNMMKKLKVLVILITNVASCKLVSGAPRSH